MASVVEFLRTNELADTLPYLQTQLPRFIIGKRLLEKHITLTGNGQVLDISFAPLQTLFLWKLGYRLVCTDLTSQRWCEDEGLYHRQGNLCYDDLDKNFYDVVVCTEVLEHLPCNLYKVRAKIVKACKEGGFILFSFPLGTIMLAPYDYDFQNLSWKVEQNHLREFSVRSAERFLDGLTIIDQKMVYTPGYGGRITSCTV